MYAQVNEITALARHCALPLIEAARSRSCQGEIVGAWWWLVCFADKTVRAVVEGKKKIGGGGGFDLVDRCKNGLAELIFKSASTTFEANAPVVARHHFCVHSLSENTNLQNNQNQSGWALL